MTAAICPRPRKNPTTLISLQNEHVGIVSKDICHFHIPRYNAGAPENNKREREPYLKSSSMSLAATQRRQSGKSASSKRLSSQAASKQRGLEVSASVDLEALEHRLRREFDLENKYGPVTGMTRMERWERAQRMGLEPPAWVRDSIAQQGTDSAINAHLFTKAA